MSDEKVTTPRLLYRGPANEHAETKVFPDQGALDAALKAGWRLTRIDAKHPAKAAPAAATVSVPAQTLQTAAQPTPAAPVTAEEKQAAAQQKADDKQAADARVADAKQAEKAAQPAKVAKAKKK
jgi:hypothetical protein